MKVEVAVQGSPVPNSPYGLCGCKANWNEQAQELCESRGGRPGLPVPNSPYGLCGCTASLEDEQYPCWPVGGALDSQECT